MDLWPIITHLCAMWIGAAVGMFVAAMCAINRD
jgi:hypothetical protein